MEDWKEEIEDSKVNTFGYVKSRTEVFLNGVLFLLIQIVHEALVIAGQLPEKWNEEQLSDVERPILIPSILLLISYFLINHAIFGGDGRMDKLQNKYGTFGIFLRKFLMMFSLLLISVTFPIIIILLFF